MRTRASAEDVVVSFSGGVPVALTRAGRLFGVTDEPTPIRRTEDAGLTHPLERLVGWRFQGTDSTGVSHVFDIERDGPDWLLVAIYD